MADTYTTLSGLFTGVADAIRSKNGSTAPIVADDFPTEIEKLRSGFTYHNHKTTSIIDYEFKNCEDLYHVDCCNITSIGNGAFENCKNLRTIIILDCVENVGKNAFKGCGENLTIYCMFDSQPETWHKDWNPDECQVVWLGGPIDTYDVSSTTSNVTAKLYNDVHGKGYSLIISGRGNMFNPSDILQLPWYSYIADINSAIIVDGIRKISDCTFMNCSSLISIAIANSVLEVGKYAFSGCRSLTSIIIPDSVITIGKYAFSGCRSLTSIVIPDSVTSIDHYAFKDCTSLTSIVIPDSVTSIGSVAFEECHSLTSIIIPDGITSIYDFTFFGCVALASIIIPDSVTSIYEYAFYDCVALTSITYTGTTVQWNSIELGKNWNSNTGNYTIHCTDGDIAKDGTITYHATE